MLSIASILMTAGGGTLSFVATPYPAGDQPVDTAAADLDGDGRADFCTLSFDASLRAYLNDGAGSFAPVLSGIAGPRPTALGLGDFDGDGQLDFAVATQSSAIQLLKGVGIGAASLVGSTTAGALPVDVAVADFDADGRLDFATVNRVGQSLSIHLGNGDLTFAPHAEFSAVVPPTHAETGDLDEDGDVDLAVSTLGSLSGSWQAMLFLGDGLGGIASTSTALLTGAPSHVALGDVDRDGHLDLAAPTHKLDVLMEVRFGNGDGTFASDYELFLGGVADNVLADLDGNGWLDSAALGASSAVHAVQSFVGGDFPFVSSAGSGVGSGPVALASADFDTDGLADLVTADAGGDTSTVLVSLFTPSVPAIASIAPLVAPAWSLVPIMIFVQGQDLDVVVDVLVDGTSLGGPSSFQLIGTTQIEFALPPLSKLGTVDIALVAPGGSAPAQIQVIANDPPLLDLAGNGILFSSSGALLTAAGKPGSLFFAAASTSFAPSDLPGLLQLDIGAGFTSLWPIWTTAVASKGWTQAAFPIAGLAPGTSLWVQAAVYDPSTGTLPLAKTNVELGVFFF